LINFPILFWVVVRAIFTHGPKGPEPRAANFQGWHIKKIEIEVWYVGEKRLSTRERFKGDLY
jgi:pyridoxine/pyridoxamine 5'-phosphate oxidase